MSLVSGLLFLAGLIALTNVYEYCWHWRRLGIAAVLLLSGWWLHEPTPHVQSFEMDGEYQVR